MAVELAPELLEILACPSCHGALAVEDTRLQQSRLYNFGMFGPKEGDTAGFVKVIADAETDELLGVHMIAPNASDLIAEVVLAFEYRGAAEDLAVTVHAHPTLSEATKEVALAALGRAIHI